MAYWFRLNMAWGPVHIEKTHHGIWDGQNVVEINGQNVVWMSKEWVQEILDKIRDTQGTINFLLSDWGNVSFHPYSARNDWSSPKVAERA